MAGKALMERRWRGQRLQRKLIRACEVPMETARHIDTGIGGNDTLLVSPQGVEMEDKVVMNKNPKVMPFRLSIDLPRATYVTIMAAVGYLLSVSTSFHSYLVILYANSDSII